MNPNPENELLGSPHRPIPIQMKEDLQVAEHVYLGEKYWVVGDGISLEFFRFNEQEFALLNWCNGKRSIDEIKERFEDDFPPHRIKHSEIQSFYIELYQKSLLISTKGDQGRHLYEIGKKKNLKKAIDQSKNVLAIKWKGINPDRILDAIAPATTWFFSKPMIAICIAVMISALGLVLTNFAEFAARLPSVGEFFNVRNFPILVCVVLTTKIIHEFAHGLVLKRFGGVCHELGVMFLVGIPTLFINTSDSWRFTDKWKRAAVGAAGIYIELLLAAVATWVWWFITPGVMEYVLLNIMVLSTLSTLFFNGNPLLRFDGYFVLCDMIEIPNLADRSGKLVRNWFLTGGLGVRETDEYRTPWQTKAWLFAYLVLSFVYKVFIAYVIAFILVKVFRPFGLEQLAKMFGLFFMVALACLPFLVLGKYFWTPGRAQKIQRVRLIATSFVLLLIGAFIAFVPFPDYVNCSFSVSPKNISNVYANYDSVLQEIKVKPGDSVSKGDIIGRLRSLDLDLQAEELRGKVAEAKSELLNIDRVRFVSVESATNRTRLEQALIADKKKLAEIEQLVNSLTLVAPNSGQVLPQWQNKQAEFEPDELSRWYGETLRNENLNQPFTRGQTVCQIGEVSELRARLIIDQYDISRLHEGQAVKLMLDSHTGQVISGELESVSKKDADGLDPKYALAFGGTVESREPVTTKNLTQDIQIKSARPVFEGIVTLDKQLADLSPGQQGKARIRVGSSPLGTKFVRFMFRTFRFEL